MWTVYLILKYPWFAIHSLVPSASAIGNQDYRLLYPEEKAWLRVERGEMHHWNVTLCYITVMLTGLQ